MAFVSVYCILIQSLLVFNGETAYELYSIGMQQEMDGDLYGAISSYQRALTLDPTEPEIYVIYASALYQVRRFAQGIAVARGGLKVSPSNPDLYEIIGIGYLGQSNLPKAIEAYEQVLDLCPDCIEYYLSLSILYEGLQDFETAQQVLLDIPDSLKSSETYVQLGLLSGKADDHSQAIEFYHTGYALDTLNTTALIGIGTGFDILGKKDSAIYYYEKALVEDTLIMSVGRRLIDLFADIDKYTELIHIATKVLAEDPEDSYVRRSLGYAYYKTGQLPKALQEFLLASRTDPQDAYSRFYLGRIYLEERRYKAAIDEIEQALKISPDFIELWVYLGFAALDMRDYALAQNAFEEAAHRGGDLVQIYYLLGVINEMQGTNHEAYRYYRKSINVDPTDLPSLEALANLCDRINKEHEAFNIFHAITKIDTLNATALNYVGYMYAENDDSLEYALALIDRALILESHNAYYIDSRGWVFYKMGRYEEALWELQRAVDIEEDVVILEHLGDVYKRLDDLDNAHDIYERALFLDPDNRILRKKLRSIMEK